MWGLHTQKYPGHVLLHALVLGGHAHHATIVRMLDQVRARAVQVVCYQCGTLVDQRSLIARNVSCCGSSTHGWVIASVMCGVIS